VKTTATILLALTLAGCSLSPSAEFIEALGKDPATVSVRINTIYGTIMFCRTAILNGNVACNGDGITVKSETAPVVQVPVQLQLMPK